MSRVAAKVFFMHIPKTGGTSVGDAAEMVLGRDRVLHVDPPEWNGAWEILDNYDFVHGHLRYEELTAMSARGWLTLVTLRNPVDRWLSMYRFDRLRTLEGPGWRELSQYPTMALPKIMSPDVFFDPSNMNFTYWDNYYVRCFGGGWDSSRTMKPRDLDAAKRNLELVDLLLLTEDLAHQWDHLARCLWGDSKGIPNSNEARSLFGDQSDLWTAVEREHLSMHIANTHGLDYLLLDWVRDRQPAIRGFLEAMGYLTGHYPRVSEESSTQVQQPGDLDPPLEQGTEDASGATVPE